MSTRVRGMKTVKTLAAVRGSGTHSNERHVHQFQLASLELEATRMGRERRAAVRRIATIDARLNEIDQLIANHQKALGLTRVDVPSISNHPGEAVAARRILRY